MTRGWLSCMYALKINMEPKHEGLLQIIVLFKRVICRSQPIFSSMCSLLFLFAARTHVVKISDQHPGMCLEVSRPR